MKVVNKQWIEKTTYNEARGRAELVQIGASYAASDEN